MTSFQTTAMLTSRPAHVTHSNHQFIRETISERFE
jgi:hypothetical protein